MFVSLSFFCFEEFSHNGFSYFYGNTHGITHWRTPLPPAAHPSPADAVRRHSPKERRVLGKLVAPGPAATTAAGFAAMCCHCCSPVESVHVILRCCPTPTIICLLWGLAHHIWTFPWRLLRCIQSRCAARAKHMPSTQRCVRVPGFEGGGKEPAHDARQARRSQRREHFAAFRRVSSVHSAGHRARGGRAGALPHGDFTFRDDCTCVPHEIWLEWRRGVCRVPTVLASLVSNRLPVSQIPQTRSKPQLRLLSCAALAGRRSWSSLRYLGGRGGRIASRSSQSGRSCRVINRQEEAADLPVASYSCTCSLVTLRVLVLFFTFSSSFLTGGLLLTVHFFPTYVHQIPKRLLSCDLSNFHPFHQRAVSVYLS